MRVSPALWTCVRLHGYNTVLFRVSLIFNGKQSLVKPNLQKEKYIEIPSKTVTTATGRAGFLLLRHIAILSEKERPLIVNITFKKLDMSSC